MRNTLILCLILLFISCSKKNASKDKDDLSKPIAEVYQEKFRPQFHFSPSEKWMNDPNGLVYNDSIYHLFYQYYPEDIVWGPMHWGHAVSKDLVIWEHKPIALFPDDQGDIFSGSAVLDKDNSSGLGTKENPPLVAIFTYHLMEGEKAGRSDFQTQGIAYSLNNGDTWTKYEGNPVIGNKNIKDFRDPKVFWHSDSGQWIMILVAGDHAKLYRSDDLKNWKYMSDFGKNEGAHGGVWECPDLFKLKIEGTNEEKWILIISINPGAPNGGSGTQYFIGDFNGHTFTAEHNDSKWLDYGADNYAGVTYNNTPDGERIFIGWMSNWNYAQKTPTKTWRSAMTLPRKLSLVQEQGIYFLKSNIIESFNKLLSPVIEKEILELDKAFIYEHQNFNQCEISFKTKLSNKVRLEFSNQKKETLVFEIDPPNHKMVLDRKGSGLINFEKQFAEIIHTLPYVISEKEVDIRIILDWSSIEIFIDNGKYVMTEQVFPTVFYNKLKMSSVEKIKVKNFKLSNINPIWK